MCAKCVDVLYKDTVIGGPNELPPQVKQISSQKFVERLFSMVDPRTEYRQLTKCPEFNRDHAKLFVGPDHNGVMLTVKDGSFLGVEAWSFGCPHVFRRKESRVGDIFRYVSVCSKCKYKIEEVSPSG